MRLKNWEIIKRLEVAGYKVTDASHLSQREAFDEYDRLTREEEDDM